MSEKAKKEKKICVYDDPTVPKKFHSKMPTLKFFLLSEHEKYVILK